MTLFGLGLLLAGQAWAGDLEITAIAHGDFDCSGDLDEAVLLSNEDGDLVVEIALKADKLSDPISPIEGPTLEFISEDKCDVLYFTAEKEEVYAVRGLDYGEIVTKAAEQGAGDSQPDLHIELRKPISHPVATFPLGLGEFKDWGGWGDCYSGCFEWVATSYQCDVLRDGTPIFCHDWDCVSVESHCL